jgi:hypothetical protein
MFETTSEAYPLGILQRRNSGIKTLKLRAMFGDLYAKLTACHYGPVGNGLFGGYDYFSAPKGL